MFVRFLLILKILIERPAILKQRGTTKPSTIWLNLIGVLQFKLIKNFIFVFWNDQIMILGDHLNRKVT